MLLHVLRALHPSQMYLQRCEGLGFVLTTVWLIASGTPL